MKQKLGLCRVCLEPVTNNICSDCLFEQVRDWLETEEEKHMISILLDVRKRLSNTFPPTIDNSQYCIMCTEEKDEVICPYCFVREAYNEFKKKDHRIAKEFVTLFNFDFGDVGYDEHHTCENVVPLEPEEKKEGEFGVCDKCGNLSGNLSETNTNLMCETCRREN